MRICIFGADGRTGREVVHQSLLDGHQVTAFVYNQDLKLNDPHINVIQGDVLNQDDVMRATMDADAVISVVGHIKDSDPLMQTKGITHIINAMKIHNVQRLVSLTGTGVRQSEDSPSPLDRILNILVSLVDPERIKDGIQHAQVAKESGLDWTIVRVLKLTNHNWTGSYRLTHGGPAERTTPRKKVARILVDLASSQDYIHQMPVSSKN